MAAPIKADIIYYDSASDFELEFNLCGCCTMRLLSDKPKDASAFLHSLSRAVSRSQLIFAVGKDDGENALLPNLCSAIGYKLLPRDLSALGIEGEVLLPEDAIPLVSTDGRLGGCVIECGPQVIITLTDDRELRRIICKELVHGYVRDLAADIDGTAHTSEPEGDKDTQDTEPETIPQNEPAISEKEDFSSFSFIEDEAPAEKVKKPRKWLKRLLILFFVLLFLAVGVAAYIFFAEPLVIKKMYKGYDEMHSAAREPVDGILDSMGELYEFNSDTIGYIKIDGTSVASPVVTTIEKGEQYYKNHLFNGWYSLMHGTPYTKSDITPQTYYRNIVIYGQDAKGGIMFDGLSSIATLEGYRLSPIISFDTLYSSNKYKIFAAFNCEGTVDAELLKTSFLDDDEFGEYLKGLLALSNIKTTVDVAASDEIITLIAYGKNDTVIVARRIRAGESEMVDTQNASANDGSLGLTDIQKLPHPTISFLPTGEIPYKQFSSNYEQIGPLSPEQVALYAAKYAKVQAEDGAEPEQVITKDNAMSVLGNINLTVYDTVSDGLVTGTTYDILCRMVEAEMGGTYEKEALKAQAIASYGWLLTSGAEGDGAPKVRLKTASDAVKEAVSEVIGLKPYYGGNVAHTMYFPCSAGYTAASASLYANTFPYLSQADSSIDRGDMAYITHNTYKADDVREWILKETGIDLSAISDKSRWFNVTYDRMGNYAEQVWFGNSATIYGGRFLRECIFTSERVGANTLSSAAYRITYQPTSDTFLFEIKGKGHGLGMSQHGANRYAKEGLTYSEILSRYYGDITISY